MVLQMLNGNPEFLRHITYKNKRNLFTETKEVLSFSEEYIKELSQGRIIIKDSRLVDERTKPTFVIEEDFNYPMRDRGFQVIGFDLRHKTPMKVFGPGPPGSICTKSKIAVAHVILESLGFDVYEYDKEAFDTIYKVIFRLGIYKNLSVRKFLVKIKCEDNVLNSELIIEAIKKITDSFNKNFKEELFRIQESNKTSFVSKIALNRKTLKVSIKSQGSGFKVQIGKYSFSGGTISNDYVDMILMATLGICSDTFNKIDADTFNSTSAKIKRLKESEIGSELNNIGHTWDDLPSIVELYRFRYPKYLKNQNYVPLVRKLQIMLMCLKRRGLLTTSLTTLKILKHLDKDTYSNIK